MRQYVPISTCHVHTAECSDTTGVNDRGVQSGVSGQQQWEQQQQHSLLPQLPFSPTRYTPLLPCHFHPACLLA